MLQDKNRELPYYPDPTYRPPPRPPENLTPQKLESKADTSPKIDTEFEENSPYQKVIKSEAYQRQDKSYFQEPKCYVRQCMLKCNFVYFISLYVNCL